MLEKLKSLSTGAKVGIASGAVLNIALDPLLIFTFGLGVAGAAWATIVSQFVSFCLLLAGCSSGAVLLAAAGVGLGITQPWKNQQEDLPPDPPPVQQQVPQEPEKKPEEGQFPSK